MSRTSSIPLLSFEYRGDAPKDETIYIANENPCEPHAQILDVGEEGHSHLLDIGIWTRNICVAGLVLSWVSGFVGIIVGAWLTHTHGFGGLTLSSDIAAELLKLGINVYVTILNEAMWFIHTVSLKWALHHEGRLEFNSNIRLFTSSRHSQPNRWSVGNPNIITSIKF